MTTAIATQEPEVRESAAQSLAQATLEAREAGFSRPELAELMGLTTAQVWRVEQGRVHDSEFEQVDAVLAKIGRGDVQPARASKPADPRQAKIDAALATIAAVPEKATKADLWQALATLTGLLTDVAIDADAVAGAE